MRAYIARRLALGVLVVWVLATLVFLMFRWLPGDPTAMFVNNGMTEEAREQVRADFGLDESTSEQYIRFLSNLVRGNFGISFYTGQSVWSILGERLLNSTLLALPAIAIGSIIGIISGMYVGWARRGSFFERAGVALATFMRGSPPFVVGILALIVFSYTTNWLPTGGIRTPGYEADNWIEKYVALDFLKHLVLPLAVLAIGYIPETLLIMRTSMLEARGEDYLDLVRAKGVSERRVMWHAARNSLLPVATYVLNSLAFSIAGVVVIETVFNWPGVGREIVVAVQRLDYPVAQGAFLIIAIVVVVMNILTDLIYGYLDPRVTYK